CDLIRLGSRASAPPIRHSPPTSRTVVNPGERTLKASPTPKASPSASVQPKAACLSLCLIHPRPPPFTGGHADRVCAARGRRRAAAVQGGQHCWKGGWGPPPRSSNLPSFAILICRNTDG